MFTKTNFVLNVVVMVDHNREMSQVVLVHPLQTFKVSARLITFKSGLFANNPGLVTSPYAVRSEVSLNDFSEFVSALEGNSVTITNDNFPGLSALCDEFCFRDLAAALSQFRDTADFQEAETAKDSEVRRRLSALEEGMQKREQEIASLHRKLLRQLQGQESATEGVLERVSRLEAELSALRSALGPPPMGRPVTAPTSTAVPPQNQNGASAPARVHLPPLSAPKSTASFAVLRPLGWNSAIVPDFPKLFEEFKQKQFTLLCRGSRDGFDPNGFHSRCNGHPNTLTVILDTDGNIFGGFTPVEWESREWEGDGCNCTKADPSLKSFLFTLRNPHNIPPRRFALKAEKKDEAIFCCSNCGLHFVDIVVFNSCAANTYGFGRRYTNDTGLDGKTVFTGSPDFQVKEIEVFEITD
jgi:hypothetical protein